MFKSVDEAVNRGNNLMMMFALAFVALGVAPEIIREDEFLDKLDDIILVLIAVAGVVWYFVNNNSSKRSWLLFWFGAAEAVVKIGALINEFDDKQGAQGDEFGLVLPLVTLVIVSAIVLVRARRRTAPSVK